jgi:hypothetical protein
VQRLPGAARAEGTFEGADPGIAAIAGKIGVAAFAVGPQLQHVASSVAGFVEKVLHFTDQAHAVLLDDQQV